jgi:hypothetical protein
MSARESTVVVPVRVAERWASTLLLRGEGAANGSEESSFLLAAIHDNSDEDLSLAVISHSWDHFRDSPSRVRLHIINGDDGAVACSTSLDWSKVPPGALPVSVQPLPQRSSSDPIQLLVGVKHRQPSDAEGPALVVIDPRSEQPVVLSQSAMQGGDGFVGVSAVGPMASGAGLDLIPQLLVKFPNILRTYSLFASGLLSVSTRLIDRPNSVLVYGEFFVPVAGYRHNEPRMIGAHELRGFSDSLPGVLVYFSTHAASCEFRPLWSYRGKYTTRGAGIRSHGILNHVVVSVCADGSDAPSTSPRCILLKVPVSDSTEPSELKFELSESATVKAMAAVPDLDGDAIDDLLCVVEGIDGYTELLILSVASSSVLARRAWGQYECLASRDVVVTTVGDGRLRVFCVMELRASENDECHSWISCLDIVAE